MRKKDREVTDKAELNAIIKKADVCRIALIDDDKPYMVALNFGYKNGNPAVLYFHCANTGRKLDVIEKNNSACFQMDIDHELTTAKKACGYSMNFKSIIGYGKIYKVTDKQEKIEGLNYIMKQYSDRSDFSYEEKMLEATTILKLEIESIKGKQKN
jgi:hypothetical protein